MTRDSQSHTHSQPHSLHLVGFWHSFTEILTEKVQNFTPSSMIILAFGEFCCYCNFDYSYPMSMIILAFTAVQWVQVCKWTSYFETQEVSSSGSTPWARFPDSSDRLIATTVWNRRGVHLEGEGSAGWQPGPRVTLTDLWSCASTMETLGLSGLGLGVPGCQEPQAARTDQSQTQSQGLEVEHYSPCLGLINSGNPLSHVIVTGIANQ